MKPSRLAALLVVLAVAACSDSGAVPTVQGAAPGRCGPPPAGSPTVTTESLLAEMTALSALTRARSTRWASRQASSYDRDSTSPEEDGWFANYDSGHFEAERVVDGRREWVMLDAEGPGALVRLWSATPQGTLRIYVDCAEEPTLQLPLAELATGQLAPFEAPFAYTAAGALSLYFPIPFQQRVVVTTDAGVEDEERGYENLFYHLGYRTYPEGTVVEPFSLARARGLGEARERAAERLRARRPSTLPSGGAEERSFTLAPGGDGSARFDIAADAGGSVVRRLRLRAEPASEEALRRTLLVLSFDGEETVRVPLGDFFGTGPGANVHSTLATEVRADGTAVVRLPMPFRERFALSLAADPAIAPTVQAAVLVEPRAWDEDSMHLHAGWRIFGPMAAERQDLHLAGLEGPGVYVGTVLSLANGADRWWGEGDERIWVDGESFPSFFGTGTEDYFGYAWGETTLFSRAYHAQSRADPPGHAGRVSLSRWHVLDAIPFEEELTFDLELWHRSPTTQVALGTVSYWYARPGTADDFPTTAPDELRVVPLEALE